MIQAIAKTVRERWAGLKDPSLADTWRWYDNTMPGIPRLIAEGGEAEERVFDPPTWQQILPLVSS